MDILELIHIESQQGRNKPHKCTAVNCIKAFGKSLWTMTLGFRYSFSFRFEGRRSDLVRHLRIHTNERQVLQKTSEWTCIFTFWLTITDLTNVMNRTVAKASSRYVEEMSLPLFFGLLTIPPTFCSLAIRFEGAYANPFRRKTSYMRIRELW
jgi:hypothetical protein